MTTPYKYRICAALPGAEPVELHRSQKQFCQKLWDSVVRDLSDVWQVWIEKPMLDRCTLSPRPPSRQGEVL